MRFVSSLSCGLKTYYTARKVHRLAASLAFFLRLSPHYEAQIQPLLEVLQTQQTLKGKLAKGPGWDKEGGIAKKDIRRLVEEVADRLC